MTDIIDSQKLFIERINKKLKYTRIKANAWKLLDLKIIDLPKNIIEWIKTPGETKKDDEYAKYVYDVMVNKRKQILADFPELEK